MGKGAQDPSSHLAKAGHASNIRRRMLRIDRMGLIAETAYQNSKTTIYAP
jgi:hypothetical protein